MNKVPLQRELPAFRGFRWCWLCYSSCTARMRPERRLEYVRQVERRALMSYHGTTSHPLSTVVVQPTRPHKKKVGRVTRAKWQICAFIW